MLENKKGLISLKNQYISIFEFIKEGVLVLDNKGIIVFSNQAANKLLNYQTNELINQSIDKLITPENRNEKSLIYKSFSQGIYTDLFEDVLLNKNNEVIQVEVNSNSIIIQEQIKGTIITFKLIQVDTNINNKSYLAKMFQSNEKYFRELADDITAMIWALDSEGQCTYVNRQWCEYTNTTFKENLGMGWLNAVHPDDLETSHGIFVDATEKKIPFRLEYRLRTRVGDYRWTIDSGSPRFNENGEILGFIGTVIDIHERKVAEEKLKKSEERYSMVIQGSNEGLWDLDLNTNQIFWSRHLYDMLGIEFSKKPITLEIFSSFLHPDELEEVNNLINKSINEDQPFETEFRMRHASGDYIDMYSRGKTYYDNNKKPTHFAGLIADITKQKTEQEKLKLLSRELEDSNKELKSFSYIASHDLQAPLRTINSYANLLTRKYSDILDDQAKKFLNTIENASKTMKNLLDDLLNYSSLDLQQNRKVFIDLNELIKKVITLNIVYIDETKAVINYKDLPTIKAERSQMIQLFQNLINNSIKYKRSNENPIINITAVKENDKWLFTVSDNAIGIDKRHFEQIFQPFKRLHGNDSYPGSGIGLATVKKIIELYGGEIWLTSEVDKGSNFYFTLPI